MLIDYIKDRKICITGLTGFLGRHLLPKLNNASVSYLARPIKGRKLLNTAAKCIAGDCVSGDGITELIRGQDIFIHMASTLFGLSWQDYLQSNVRSCQNIVKAINSLPEDERPGKVIFISSLSAAGPCAVAPGLTEDSIPSPVSAYGWSKLLCEKILSQIKLPLVIIRPPIIYGSGDRGLLPMFKSARYGFGMSPGAFRKFPVSVIHADDAADSILLCCSPKASGIYHIGDGKIYNMDIICQTMSAAFGKTAYIAHFPLPILATTAYLANIFSIILQKLPHPDRISFKAPQWNMDKYREAKQIGWLADTSRICQELNFMPKINLSEGMKEAVEGYRTEGWL